MHLKSSWQWCSRLPYWYGSIEEKMLCCGLRAILTGGLIAVSESNIELAPEAGRLPGNTGIPLWDGGSGWTESADSEADSVNQGRLRILPHLARIHPAA